MRSQARLIVGIRRASWRWPSDRRSGPPRSLVISARTSRNRRAQGPRLSASTNSVFPLVTRDRWQGEAIAEGRRSGGEFSMVLDLGCGGPSGLEKAVGFGHGTNTARAVRHVRDRDVKLINGLSVAA